MAVQRANLSGGRLHLHHGPIDLVIGADGDRTRAFAAAEARLGSVLSELMSEMALLRVCDGPRPKGEIARKMWQAANVHSGFVTPMAGVAGAVAETVLQAMCDAVDLNRAYVNNGGDIALHLQGSAEFSIAMAGVTGAGFGKITLNAASPVRGIATSGQGGRSLSMGIADSVTVLASTASAADVAATLIANAVDLPDHPMIARAPARGIRDDSELGDLPVVTFVDHLNTDEVARALARGAKVAGQMQNAGLAHAASLHLRGQSRQIELHTEKVLEHARG
ncbi:MAG: UPF0280 family protein [Planktotalea sp.]|uniref:UPF0280 family protein n=1 Tax=Planktotalea sp. TaxID=2029877 RepID=UPI003C7137CF